MKTTAILLLASVSAAVWCRAALEALARISWVTIRKDSFKRTGFEDRAERWLEHRDHLCALLRFAISLFFSICAMACLMHLQQQAPDVEPIWGVLVTALVVALAFSILLELLVLGVLGQSLVLLLYVSAPILRLLLLFSPIYGIFEAKRPKSENEEEDPSSTLEDEIKSLVEQDEHENDEDAELEASERQMIRGIFDLDETLVREIMTPRVDMKVVRVDSTFAEAKEVIVDCGHSRIPVIGNTIDDVQGVIYAKDLLDDARLAEVESLVPLLHKPLFVPESKNVRHLLDDFRVNKIHFAVIIDEYGGTAGIVTFEDILEEIVGEIHDEYDEDEQPLFKQQEDGSYLIDARTPVGTVNEFLDSDIPEKEEYDTLGGFVISEFGRIPAAEESLEAHGLLVIVLEASERYVSQLAVKMIPQNNDD